MRKRKKQRSDSTSRSFLMGNETLNESQRPGEVLRPIPEEPTQTVSSNQNATDDVFRLFEEDFKCLD